VKKAMFALVVLIVVLLPGLGQAQERSGNNTLPYTLWLPVVEMPSLEDTYPGCPYRTTLVSPEDGEVAAISTPPTGSYTAVFTWDTEAPEAEIWRHHCMHPGVPCTKDLIEFTDPLSIKIASGNQRPFLRFSTDPGLWRVRAVCREGDNVEYGPFTDTWFFRSPSPFFRSPSP
jgi:hypothetical protein